MNDHVAIVIAPATRFAYPSRINAMSPTTLPCQRHSGLPPSNRVLRAPGEVLLPPLWEGCFEHTQQEQVVGVAKLSQSE